jgi:ribonuclease-3
LVKNIRKFYNYYLSSEKDLARKLKPILGFTPAYLPLFRRAVYHKSLNVQKNGYTTSNERLEYLGDSILSAIVAEYLFQKYPSKDEGFLTKMRSRIVKRKTLNSIGEQMGLDMILSEFSNGKLSNSMLGNALEAIIGAVYLEFGYRRTRDYVIRNILMRYLDIHKLETTDDNHKSILLEWCQKYNKEVNFKLVSRQKQNKRDFFVVAVNMDGEDIATAQDFSKKSAEQSASKLAIQKLNIA